MYAIIGIGFRLPGKTNTPEDLFNNLKEKKDLVSEIPATRWNKDFYFHPDKHHPGTMITKRAGFIEPYFDFDYEAFSFSIKEAKSIDPAVKILLECAHETLEDANVKYKGTRTGVFIGTGQQCFSKYATTDEDYTTEYTATGSETGIQSNMVSYKFDLRGPSMTCDTACSSAGTALYNAINAFENDGLEMALVGGFNNLLNQNMTVAFSRLGVLSPDGKCKPFDIKANGYVRSEGCGFVLVKPFKKALMDGDHIYTIIKGIHSNEDGALESSLTKPSWKAQQSLIKGALKKAKVEPKDVLYVEAHSAGTAVGDPAECEAIGRVCNIGRPKEKTLRVGSIKRAIGHTEFASFMCGLLKCCVMYDKKHLLPTKVETMNPKIRTKLHNLRIQTETEAFDPHGKVMVVNSFGFGGGNVCCVLEGFTREERKFSSPLAQVPYIYTFSGRTEKGLSAREEQYKKFSETFKDQHKLSYATCVAQQVGSRFFSYAIGDSLHKSISSQAYRIPDKKPPLVFVFSGQGPQYYDMGRQLYKNCPAFRSKIDECDKIYKKISGVSIVHDIGLYHKPVNDPKIVNRVSITLPGILFTQLALFNYFGSIGIKPDLIVGHSAGEMASLHANGALSLEKILRVTYSRGQICETIEQKGIMMAIGASSEYVLELIKEHKIEKIWIAAENSPVSVSVGGIRESVMKLNKICEDLKIFHAVLSITNAFHTPLLWDLKEYALGMFPSLKESNAPSIRFFSTVTGAFWDAPFTKEYLWLNVQEKVSFKKAITSILSIYGKDTVFLEIAPHPVLSLSLKQCGAKNVVFSMQRKKVEKEVLLQAVGRIASFGYEVSWDNVMGKSERRIASLPRYPFQREPCFQKVEANDAIRFANEFKNGVLPLIGRKDRSTVGIWTNKINTLKFEWMEDHVINDTIIYPAAGYIEQFLEVEGNHISEVKILNPVVVPTKNNVYVVLETKKIEDKLIISTRKPFDEDWTINSTCMKGSIKEKSEYEVKDKAEYLKQCTKEMKKREAYEKCDLKGLMYKRYFQTIDNLRLGDDEAYGTLNFAHLRKEIHAFDSYKCHPAVVDGMLQVLELTERDMNTFLPTYIKNIHVYKPLKGYDALTVYSYISNKTTTEIVGSAILFDQETKEVIVELDNIVLTSAKAKQEKRKDILTVNWQSKKFIDLDFNGFKSAVSPEWKEIERKLPEFINQIKGKVNSSFNRVKHLTFPEEKHSFMNWLKKVLTEKKIEEVKKEITKTELKGFDIEYDLIDSIVKEFALILRKKPLKEQEIRKTLLSKYIEQSISMQKTTKIVKSLFEQIKTKGSKRVIRILECGRILSFYKIIAKYIKETELETKIELFVSCNDVLKEIEDLPYLEIKKIDLSKPLDTQGIQNDSLDLVLINGFTLSSSITTNITKSIVPNGLFLFVQPKEHLSFLTNLLFGLLDINWVIPEQVNQISLKTIEELLKSSDFVSKSLELDGNILAIGIKNELTIGTKNDKIQIFEETDPIKLLKFVQNNNKINPCLIVTKGVVQENQTLHAGKIGFARNIANEYPEWKVKTCDFSTKLTTEEEKKWMDTICSNFDRFEYEFCVQENNQVYVPRLVKIPENTDITLKKTEEKAKEEVFRLSIDKLGVLNELHFHYIETPMIKDDEVLVKTVAASLNFRDLMVAQNMLKLDTNLGLEFSGVITKVGNKVTKYKVGDEVFGFGDSSIASHVVANHNMITKKPSNISHELAASIPTVFVTPYYALVKKAGIDEQDDPIVLIHSAAGGVGQASIQLVKHFGGTIVATCGSQEKRDYLNKKYGVTIFGNSHTSSWDDEILAKLKEKGSKPGVDVILNSLSKDHISRGIKMLVPFGSFIEIGKRDIMANNPLYLAPFLQNLSYYSVHLDKMMETRKKLVGKMLEEVTELIGKGVVVPVVDKVFGSNEIVKSFRYMQSGKHRGKIIISFSEENKKKTTILPRTSIFSQNKTYILTGGLGAVGFKLSQWMVEQGARNIVYLSRSGNTKKSQKREIKRMEEQFNAKIVISKTDVSNEESVKKMYKELVDLHKLPEIGGIIHLAMVLRDNSIEKQTEEAFNVSFGAKMNGAKHIVNQYPGDIKDLEFILFFSSISGIIGNLHQSNYCYANSFLDVYAQYLVKEKQANAKVINLGAVIDVGVIAEDLILRKIMNNSLLNIAAGMTMSQVIDAVKELITDKNIVQYIPSTKFEQVLKTFPFLSHKYSHLLLKNKDSGSKSSEASAFTQEDLIKTVAELLSMEPSRINVEEKLTSYGVDSLLAVELSTVFEETYGIAITQMQLLGGLSIQDIIEMTSQ